MRLISTDKLKAIIGQWCHFKHRETFIFPNSISIPELFELIETAPTVKAIPIEFIEEQIAKTTDINNRDELDVLYAGNLGYLLKLWEKENADL